MDFGITIKPDLTIDRIVSLTQQAESAGCQYGWIFDSHVIWMEPFPLLTLMAANTKQMRLGTCVTNPAVRDVTVSASLFATLNVFSHGRMQLGIGRGDSSRRVLGKKPTTLENLEEFVRVFRALNSRHAVELDGARTRALVPCSRLQSRDGPHLEIQAGRTAPIAGLFRERPRKVRLSAPLRSGQQQRRFRYRRNCGPLLSGWPHRTASQKARSLAKSRRNAIQHLPDVRRRRTNPGHLRARCPPARSSVRKSLLISLLALCYASL